MSPKIVVDTNKVFSALLKPGIIRETLPFADLPFIAPNFIAVEIFKHHPKILKYSVQEEKELVQLYRQIND